MYVLNISRQGLKIPIEDSGANVLEAPLVRGYFKSSFPQQRVCGLG